MTIFYQVNFKRFYEHLSDVSLSFVAQDNAPVLWLPTWIAGSYLIREFSKHITTIYYTIDGTEYRASKLTKNQYRLDHLQAGQNVLVHYEVYCHDLSVRTAFVDDSRIFGNFTSLLLMIQGQENTPCQISLSVPTTFLQKNPNTTLASGLKHTTQETDTARLYVFETVGAFDSYDYPFEIGTQSEFAFMVDNQGKQITHRFFIAGKHSTDLHRLAKDVQAICQSYVKWLGDTPFDDYTFMTMVTGGDFGGLEHINSTALISPRTDLPSVLEASMPSPAYQSFLGLCSHEYFHAWWVKSVRPDVMMTSNLQHEAYTPLLWVFEGFTSYVDDLMLLASGVIDEHNYLKLLEAQLNRYAQTDGKAYQSVAESSFDTWIKLYRPDENTANQSVSYYNKGALVALCLDLTLLRHSAGKYRLLDVIKTFYEKSKTTPNKRFGMTTEHLGDVIGALIGADKWQQFYEDFVVGVRPLPIDELLADFGVSLTTTDQIKAWGMSIDETPAGLKITHLNRQSSASLAGLSVGDVVVAIDGIKASKSLLNTATTLMQQHAHQATVHAFRRDELRTFVLTNHPTTHQQYTLRLDQASDKPNAWLDLGLMFRPPR